MSEQHRIIQRLFIRAAEKHGSTAFLARHLAIPYSELRLYIQGEAMPPEAIILRAVDLILEELPAIRSEFAPEAWASLSPPK